LAGALFFLLTPLLAFAQKTSNAANSPGTSLKGTVTAQDGQALAGVAVKLARNPPLGVPMTGETDEKGHYEFHNLQSGNYSITVESAGFKEPKKRFSSKMERKAFRISVSMSRPSWRRYR
jgi:protocatechuate 3,4-dioxygenase beta subunit